MLTIKQIYNLAVELGIKNDLRGRQACQKKLVREKEKFEKIAKNGTGKEFYDQERLKNPFSDTRFFGDPNKKIKKILTGIDISVSELLIAKELSVDLVISHHPLGIALAGLDDVMELQIELLASYGVPINIAEKMTKKRISEISRALSPGNHNRVLDNAKILGLNVMCMHTPADNCVANYFKKELEKNKGKMERVKDVLDLIDKIPEHQEAKKLGIGPMLFVGAPDSYAGKIVLTDITGGTSGSKEIYPAMANAGIGTIIGMHMGEEYRKEAEKAHINVVVAGHMSSDSLGMNIILDEIEKKGVEIIPTSGLIRIKRFKKK